MGRELHSKNQTNPLKLQSISVQIMTLSQLIAEAEGEITLEVEDALVGLSKELKGTTDVYGFLLKRLNMEAQFLRQEARDYAERARKTETAIEKIEARIKDSLKLLKTNRLEGNRYGFQLKKARPKAKIDENVFPSHLEAPTLWREKIEYKIDREAVLKKLLANEKIKGAELEEVFALMPLDMFPTMDVGGSKKSLKGNSND